MPARRSDPEQQEGEGRGERQPTPTMSVFRVAIVEKPPTVGAETEGGREEEQKGTPAVGQFLDSGKLSQHPFSAVFKFPSSGPAKVSDLQKRLHLRLKAKARSLEPSDLELFLPAVATVSTTATGGGGGVRKGEPGREHGAATNTAPQLLNPDTLLSALGSSGSIYCFYSRCGDTNEDEPPAGIPTTGKLPPVAKPVEGHLPPPFSSWEDALIAGRNAATTATIASGAQQQPGGVEGDHDEDDSDDVHCTSYRSLWRDVEQFPSAPPPLSGFHHTATSSAAHSSGGRSTELAQNYAGEGGGGGSGYAFGCTYSELFGDRGGYGSVSKIADGLYLCAEDQALDRAAMQQLGVRLILTLNGEAHVKPYRKLTRSVVSGEAKVKKIACGKFNSLSTSSVPQCLVNTKEVPTDPPPPGGAVHPKVPNGHLTPAQFVYLLQTELFQPPAVDDQDACGGEEDAYSDGRGTGPSIFIRSVPAEDRPSFDLSPFFRELTDLMYLVLYARSLQQEKERTCTRSRDPNSAQKQRLPAVLVHCMAGVSRSSTIVAAYLMRRTKLDRDDVLSAMQRMRPIVNPNLGFMTQLDIYQLCGYKNLRETSAEELAESLRIRYLSPLERTKGLTALVSYALTQRSFRRTVEHFGLLCQHLLIPTPTPTVISSTTNPSSCGGEGHFLSVESLANVIATAMSESMQLLIDEGKWSITTRTGATAVPLQTLLDHWSLLLHSLRNPSSDPRLLVATSEGGEGAVGGRCRSLFWGDALTCAVLEEVAGFDCSAPPLRDGVGSSATASTGIAIGAAAPCYTAELTALLLYLQTVMLNNLRWVATHNLQRMALSTAEQMCKCGSSAPFVLHIPLVDCGPSPETNEQRRLWHCDDDSNQHQHQEHEHKRSRSWPLGTIFVTSYPILPLLASRVRSFVGQSLLDQLEDQVQQQRDQQREADDGGASEEEMLAQQLQLVLRVFYASFLHSGRCTDPGTCSLLSSRDVDSSELKIGSSGENTGTAAALVRNRLWGIRFPPTTKPTAGIRWDSGIDIGIGPSPSLSVFGSLADVFTGSVQQEEQAAASTARARSEAWLAMNQHESIALLPPDQQHNKQVPSSSTSRPDGGALGSHLNPVQLLLENDIEGVFYAFLEGLLFHHLVGVGRPSSTPSSRGFDEEGIEEDEQISLVARRIGTAVQEDIVGRLPMPIPLPVNVPSSSRRSVQPQPDTQQQQQQQDCCSSSSSSSSSSSLLVKEVVLGKLLAAVDALWCVQAGGLRFFRYECCILRSAGSGTCGDDGEHGEQGEEEPASGEREVEREERNVSAFVSSIETQSSKWYHAVRRAVIDSWDRN